METVAQERDRLQLAAEKADAAMRTTENTIEVRGAPLSGDYAHVTPCWTMKRNWQTVATMQPVGCCVNLAVLDEAAPNRQHLQELLCHSFMQVCGTGCMASGVLGSIVPSPQEMIPQLTNILLANPPGAAVQGGRARG